MCDYSARPPKSSPFTPNVTVSDSWADFEFPFFQLSRKLIYLTFNEKSNDFKGFPSTKPKTPTSYFSHQLHYSLHKQSFATTELLARKPFPSMQSNLIRTKPHGFEAWYDGKSTDSLESHVEYCPHICKDESRDSSQQQQSPVILKYYHIKVKNCKSTTFGHLDISIKIRLNEWQLKIK